MIFDEQLAEWRALAEAATPGPWTILGRGSDSWFVRGPVVPNLESLTGVDEDRSHIAVCQAVWRTAAEADANQAFIAAARTGVPALLAEVERLKGWETSGVRNAMMVGIQTVEIEQLEARLAALLPLARAARWLVASSTRPELMALRTALEALPAELLAELEADHA